jgi:predicted enzyme related to lactoylglutathione lyase
MTNVAICIDVPDLQAAEAFYCDALGLTKLGGHAKNSKLSTGNAEIYLLLKEAGSSAVTNASVARTYSRHWTPVHLDFRVENFDRALENVIGHGGTREETQSGDWGSIAYCADPFGNGFCLIRENS